MVYRGWEKCIFRHSREPQYVTFLLFLAVINMLEFVCFRVSLRLSAVDVPTAILKRFASFEKF